MSLSALARAPVAAVAFLTRIPVGRRFAFDGLDVGRGAALFPLVGAGLGLVSGLAADALVPTFPPLLAGALAVGIAALLTGAMHFDALADAADALGGTTRERSLEIMRDHTIGAFGGVALVVVCLVDASAIGSLATSGKAALACLAAGAIGRAAMLPLSLVLPYARPGTGLGRVLDGLGVGGVAVGLVIGVAASLALGWTGLLGLVAGLVTASALGLYFRRWLGGVTGDTLGATAKLAESVALVTMLGVGFS
jgi:adenosylcobinamide-GDP ribazoletransferase